MTSVAFDTNLLVLLLVGRVAPGLIGRHKRLRSFTASDYDTLIEILGQAGDLLVIPQCIAEVSNLAVQGVAEPLRSEILLGLAVLVESAVEKGVTSAAAVAQDAYIRLGITDAAWLEAITSTETLVTADTDLFLAALSNGRKAIHFSDLRS